MSTISAVKSNTFGKYLASGIIAGLGGGVVFGMMMAIMNMLPLVAGLIGSQSVVVGGLVHMAISAAIGGFYGAVLSLGRVQLGWGSAVLTGMVNGVTWWVLGGLILMPLGLGMTEMVLKIGTDQWLSLMGHLIYGVVTGVLFVVLLRKK